MRLGLIQALGARMKNDRLRNAVKADYVEALGRAAFSFASCEWQVAWCAERLQKGALRKITGEEMTAGEIAHFFKNICRNLPASPLRETLKGHAQAFIAHAEKRNEILHGKPCTGPNGQSRLSGKKVLEIPDLEDAADAFEETAIALNDIYYRHLVPASEAGAQQRVPADGPRAARSARR